MRIPDDKIAPLPGELSRKLLTEGYGAPARPEPVDSSPAARDALAREKRSRDSAAEHMNSPDRRVAHAQPAAARQRKTVGAETKNLGEHDKERRREERRKEQRPVLLDTRTGPRRRSRLLSVKA